MEKERFSSTPQKECNNSSPRAMGCCIPKPTSSRDACPVAAAVAASAIGPQCCSDPAPCVSMHTKLNKNDDEPLAMPTFVTYDGRGHHHHRVSPQNAGPSSDNPLEGEDLLSRPVRGLRTFSESSDGDGGEVTSEGDVNNLSIVSDENNNNGPHEAIHSSTTATLVSSSTEFQHAVQCQREHHLRNNGELLPKELKVVLGAAPSRSALRSSRTDSDGPLPCIPTTAAVMAMAMAMASPQLVVVDLLPQQQQQQQLPHTQSPCSSAGGSANNRRRVTFSHSNRSAVSSCASTSSVLIGTPAADPLGK